MGEGVPAAAPPPPPRSRVGQGSPWPSRMSAGPLGEDAGAGLAQQPPAVDGGRGQGVTGLQPGGDQRLDLPGGAGWAAASRRRSRSRRQAAPEPPAPAPPRARWLARTQPPPKPAPAPTTPPAPWASRTDAGAAGRSASAARPS